MNHPNAELIAVNWLKLVDGLNSDLIATVAPAHSDEFEADGFCRVSSFGGRTHPYYPIHDSIIRLDTLAYTKNSTRKPWGKAYNLMQIVLETVPVAESTLLTLPDPYNNARIRSIAIGTDPVRLNSPLYAGYRIALKIQWSEVEKE